MAEAIVGPLLSKLQEVAVKEAKALAEVGGDIDKLRDKLLWLHALVHEADLRSRQDGSRLVRVLAFQIRDAGFDVEDAVDRFYLQGSLARRFGRYNWWRISKEFIVNLRTHVFVRAILSRRIRSINVRLDEIMGNNSTYSFSSQSGSADGKTWRASRAIPPMRTDWDRDYSKDFVLKYRRKEREELMKEINKNDVSEVITVVGVEGVGKTALLMHAYKQVDIKEDYLKVRIWLSFPPDISDERMFQQIEEELGNKGKAMGKDPKEVCCLVVIHSPFSTTTWHKVGNKILELVGKGSKIVLSVTSSWREEKINQGTTINLVPMNRDDSKEETHCTIRLGSMIEAESTKLFNYIYGLGGRRGTNYQVAEMNHIRDHIMEITSGLPLAVVLLAKLMRTMDFGKWEAAAGYLKCNSEDNKLKTILSVCIDDLSDELKSCLLYTAGFPENRPIDAHQLVRLWMAEGFLTQQHKLETEKLGQCYLKELIYRGLLHLEKKAPGGNVLWVAIPYQIHPLLRSEAQRTSFMDVHYGGSLPPSGNTRRLALHGYNDKFPALDNCLEKLRTVFSYSDDYMNYPYDHEQEKSNKDGPEPETETRPKPEPEPKLVMREFLQRSPYLRVINLEGIQVEKKKKNKGHVCALPAVIGEMVHLQYLGVRCRELKEVPSSIGNLRNLQTIDVRGTGVRSIPESLWKVKTLRHVLGDRLAFPRSSTGVGDHLKLMHTLESVTIDHQADGSCRCTTATPCKRRKLNLLCFRFLHRLHVTELKKSQGEELASVLKHLSYLEALILSGEHIPMHLFAKEWKATASWMKHMEFLMLDGPLHLQDASNKKLVDHPCLDSCLVNVTHLVLRSTDIGQTFIDWIGKLPFLSELELHDGSYKDEKLKFNTGEFYSLTMLRISGRHILKEITVSDATTRENRNKAINMDVPDHVTVVMTDKNNVPGDVDEVVTGQHSPSDQQLISASGQQPEGGQETTTTTAHGGQSMEDSSPLKDKHHNGIITEKATTKTNHGEKSMEGGSPSEDERLNIITEMILEAADENNSSITSITNYIKDTHVVKCLDNMVRSHKLRKEKTKNGRSSNKYVLKGKSSLLTEEDGGPLPDNLRVITKMILEAPNKKDYYSITSISNYIRDTYVAKCLDRMVKSDKLKKQKVNGYYKYVVLDRSLRGRNQTSVQETKAVSSST